MIFGASHAFPLDWPDQKPRTPAHERRPNLIFGIEKRSVAYGARRINRALQQLDASSVIISSDAHVHLDDFTDSSDPQPSDPGVCISFHLEDKVYLICCDAHTTVVANMTAIARHLEGLKLLERFRIASAPEMLRCFEAKPSPAVAKTWREVLGDLRSTVEVNAAFRRLSTDFHPDRTHGSHHAMTELSRCRDEALSELEGLEQDCAVSQDANSEAFVFEASKDFAAMRAAERFLEERGFGYGLNERGMPRGVLFSNFDIAKWSDLSEAERSGLDGRMTGDMRRGPVTVTISRSALERAASEAEITWDGAEGRRSRLRSAKMWR